MSLSGQRWTIYDRYGHPIYLTNERWEHIIDEDNHPEMTDLEEQLKITVSLGRRTQEPQSPRKYRYIHQFDQLPVGSTHIIAIVIFGFTMDEQDNMQPNNWIATAFPHHIRAKG